MKDFWKNLTVKEVLLAIFVAPSTGKSLHENRPSHGLILNDAFAQKTYYFLDGTVLNTYPNEVYYLPKGSTYKVGALDKGGCYAINFDADIIYPPFKMRVRDIDGILRSFSVAEKSWRLNKDNVQLVAKKAIYDIVLRLFNEIDVKYVPNSKFSLLNPALDILEDRFNQNDLTVAYLSDVCGVSEAYFRRLFNEKFGISPREYIIKKRIDYAKTLLSSGQFAVSEVASICGYKEPCHFSREFVKMVGVPPKYFI